MTAVAVLAGGSSFGPVSAEAQSSLVGDPGAETASTGIPAPPEFVGATPLALGEDQIGSAVTDGTHGYFGTNTVPAQIVKVRLSDMARVGALTLNPGESGDAVAATDGTFGYFALSPATASDPIKVVKVRLADMTRAGEGIAVDPAPNPFPGYDFRKVEAVVLDGTSAYWAITSFVTPRVVKMRLSDLARTTSIDLRTDAFRPSVATTDGTYGYFGISGSPGYGGPATPAAVVKVQLGTMTQVAAGNLSTSELNVRSAIADREYMYLGVDDHVVKVRLLNVARVGAVRLPSGSATDDSAISDGTFGYFGTDASPGRVEKILLEDLSRMEALALNTGEDNLGPAIADGTFGYFGTKTDPGQVVKVRLSNMTRVGSVTLRTVEADLQAAVTDGTHAYFGTGTNPGQVVKVRLSDMSRVGVLRFNTGENDILSATTDGTFGYFGTSGDYSTPGKIVKVRLSDMTRVNALSLNAGETGAVTAMAVDGFGYFGTSANEPDPSSVVKVRLSDMTREASLKLTTDAILYEESITVAVTDGTFGYFGTSSPGKVVKVRLSDMTRVASIFLTDVSSGPQSAVLSGGFAYFGALPGVVARVRLSDLTQTGSVVLNDGEELLRSAITDGTNAYFGADSGTVVKVRLSDMIRVGASAPTGPDDTARSAVMVGNFGYFGVGTAGKPGSVVKVALRPEERPGRPRVVPGIGSLTVTVVPPSSGLTPTSYVATATAVGTVTTGNGSSCTVTGASGTCTITGLGTGGTYRVSVIAQNASGSSPASPPSPAPPQVVTPGRGSPITQFADVPGSAGYVEATSMLKARGIARGVGQTNNFNPGGTVTRADMAAFLYRMAGQPAVSACTFKDAGRIPAYAQQAACWLKANRITTNDPFNPAGLVTRSQMASFLHRFAGQPAVAGCRFKDPQYATSAPPPTCWLKASGITTNDPFNPAGLVTRSQMALFLYRTGGTLGLWVGPS